MTSGADAVSSQSDPEAAGALSDSTRAVLANLSRPVEVRYYALLDPASASAAVGAFASRVDRLLAQYERSAAGKLTVARHDSMSDANTDAAEFEGLRPLTLNQGTANFLGLAVANEDSQELIRRLSPEWEQALESDLSRMIERMGKARKPDQPRSVSAEGDPATTAEVKRLIPNLGSVSLSEGTQILREATLKDFTIAAKEMETKIRAAQQRLSSTRNGGSEATQQSAIRELQQIQAEQTDRLQQIAKRLQDQIAALEYLKTTTAASSQSK
jgi:ABC-type uncharacterized transport system involved in gliding motility auxiliary subunit